MILRPFARLSVLALAAMLALLPLAARADIFTVTDVHLDATADSVTAARDEAMAQGQVAAVQKLWERLVAPESRALIPPLSASELSDYYIQSLRVSGEQTSTNRYIADLTVQFRPEQIRQFLRTNNVPYAETQSQPVLVLPIYGPAGSAVLWADSNPWLSAWQQYGSDHDLVPVVSPLGDLEDISGIDAAKAEAGDSSALSAMAARYGADDVLVSRAALNGDPAAGNATLQITSQRYLDAQGTGRSMTTSVSQEAGQDLPDMMQVAVARVSRDLQGDWLSRNQLRYDQQAQLEAVVPVNSLDELVEVQRRLGEIAAVRDYYTLSVSRTAAEIGLVYYGDPIQLQRALAQFDLSLEQIGAPTQGQPGWQIRLTRAALEIDSAPLGGDGSLETLPQYEPAQPEAPQGSPAPGSIPPSGATPQAAPGATSGSGSTVRPLTDASGRPVQVPAEPTVRE